MKRICFAVSAMCFCMLIAMNLLAGDVPESIITDQNTDVILGTITKIGDVKTTIEVSRALFETIDDKEIELDNFNYFTGSEETPKVGDYCAVAVVRENDALALYYALCAKADSLEPETLKLAQGHDFVTRMNGYINDGSYSKVRREGIIGQPSESPTPTGPALNSAEPKPAPFTASLVQNEPEAPERVPITNKPLLIIFGIVMGVIAVAVFIYSAYEKSIKSKETDKNKRRK